MYIELQNFRSTSEFKGNPFLVPFLFILKVLKRLRNLNNFFMIQLNTFFSGFIGVILCMTLYMPMTFGQCPTPIHTTIQKSENESFKSSHGKISFDFKDGESPGRINYRIRLYDKVSERFLYDDNHPPFLNTVPAPSVEFSKIIFEALPEGRYVLVLHGKACNQQVFEVSENW